MLNFSLYQSLPGSPFVSPSFDDEPEPRRSVLSGFLIDMYGQENLYLAEIAKAEAGETILDLYNQQIHAYLYPDGRVVLEQMRWSDDDEAELGPPARTELTLAELKQLIHDWLAAKEQWQQQQAAAQAAAAVTPPPAATPGTPPAPPPDHESLP